MAEHTPLRSTHEWLKDDEFVGFEILDPDGWDRKNLADSLAEEIDRDEMRRRLFMSSCRFTVPR